MDKSSILSGEKSFLAHVKSSILHPERFTALYYTVGVAEECSELYEELSRPKVDVKMATSEAGDVVWYVYALCNKFGDVEPVPALRDEADITELFIACGALAGSVKKFSRGDKDWGMFRDRIQRNVSELLGVVLALSPCTLEEAMQANVDKISGRRQRGTVKGDGELR